MQLVSAGYMYSGVNAACYKYCDCSTRLWHVVGLAWFLIGAMGLLHGGY